MPVSIVVGGQYGSEGKGKVVALLSSRVRTPWLVRCGGPNSGHTVTLNGESLILRQVPSSHDPENSVFCIAAGCVVDESLLLNELELLQIEQDRILVDPRAVVVTEADRVQEAEALSGIGSTFSGTGAALMRRMARRGGVLLAQDATRLRSRCRIQPVAPALHAAIQRGEQVIVEGTQGFGLSLLHGPHYPFVTSRDTTASGFASEVGLSPRAIDEIVMVVRTYPIRVGGNSGPLADEITWDDVRLESGAPETIAELTSVTRRIRRVARFDFEAVRTACAFNQPTSLAVMGMDRLDFVNHRAAGWNELTDRAKNFIAELERKTQTPVSIVGTGFDTADALNVEAFCRTESHAR